MNLIDLRIFLSSFFSPSLYMLQRTVWEKYSPNEWEKFGDTLVGIIITCFKIGIYGSPFWATYMYRRGHVTYDVIYTISKIGVGVGVIMGSSYCIRSYGRVTNDKYKLFLNKLKETTNTTDLNKIKEIKRYDFEFSSWPVEFENNHRARTIQNETKSWRSSLTSLIHSPCSILGYLVLHTFGIRMIYQGSTTFLNFLLSSALMDGRKVLIESKRGERFKLKTADGNFIDSMFVDKRSVGSEKSKILVICSEGNAGFYEIGIMQTAIDGGFSVLGWNHPGFGCSTGMPYPDQEQNAMDTVMQFALVKLGFEPSNIILFGWSIGGYPTSWAAMQYPDIRGVVLDATFDDLLPLALNQMPEFLDSLVRLTIRSYADLHVANFLCEYPGPVKLIRRTEDEIICITPGDISTNRGNFLLKKLLKRRYPALFTQNSETALQDWLKTYGLNRNNVVEIYEVDRDLCQGLIQDYTSQNGPQFPFTTLGKESTDKIKISLLLYLAEKYMIDLSSGHCEPLPSSLFVMLSNF